MSSFDDTCVRLRAAIGSEDFKRALAMLPELRELVEERLRGPEGNPEALRAETISLLQWALRSVAVSREHIARMTALVPRHPLYAKRSGPRRPSYLETEG
jgi:hypothetical protein